LSFLAAAGLRVPLRELRFEFARSSGPGGQNVNRVETKATLVWDVRRTRSLPADARERLLERARRRISGRGELRISSQRFRDRSRNVADCLEKLRALLAEVAVAPRQRRPTRPGMAARERRLGEKRRRGLAKQRRRGPAAED
jgi:ribosome-associated protein